MRRRHLFAPVLLVVALSACSDDDGGDEAAGSTSPAPTTASPDATTAVTDGAVATSAPGSDTTVPDASCDAVDGGPDALAGLTSGQALAQIADASTFAATVETMGMTAELDDGGPFTLFVPTDAAFAALGPGAPSLEELVAGHVVDAGPFSVTALASSGGVAGRLDLITVADTPEGVLADRGGGPGTVTCRDITTANGVIHLLDAVLRPAPDDTQAVGGTQVYTVDLATGATTPLGGFSSEAGVLGVAAALDGVRMYAVTDAGGLLSFTLDDPAAAESMLITGIEMTTLLALDMTPDGRLIAIGDDGTAYAIDPASGAATRLPAALPAPLDDPGLGFDVDADGVGRVIVASGLNVEIDLGAGAATNPLAPPTFDAEDVNVAAVPRVVATASTPDGEEFYVIDATTGSLAMTTSPPDGVLLTVGAIDVPLTDGASLDIAPDGTAVLTVPG